MLNIVERFLPCLGDCCAVFCHTIGIGQADVILCFARALMCSRLKPLRIGAECVGTDEWGGGSRICECVVTHSEGWAMGTCVDEVSDEALLGVQSAIESIIDECEQRSA